MLSPHSTMNIVLVLTLVIAYASLVISFRVWSNGITHKIHVKQPAAATGVHAADQSLQSDRRDLFGSKLFPVYEEELVELFKEFNITNVDINNDPELAKWYPTKEFFEKYGFKDHSERYKRTVQDVKTQFYGAYTKPLLPQYKTFIGDMLTVVFIQVVDARYEYDELHAFGLCTQYYTVMKGYPLQDEIDKIFNELMSAVGFDPNKLRDDAKKVLTLIKESNLTEDDLLKSQDGLLGTVFNGVRANRFFKYTDSWGVGLGRVMELIGVEPNNESFDRWSKSLKWIFTPRLMQSWSEFCGDQIRMQGVEAMQKQLLIREKKRAAGRLEKKASQFEDKKKALLVLNDAIEERRQQIIEEQKALKRQYEPDEYDKLIKQAQSESESSALSV